MSRATEALLAVVGAVDTGMPDEDRAANDELAAQLARERGDDGIDLLAWIDALALALAAGIRVGARGLVEPAVNDSAAAPPAPSAQRAPNTAPPAPSAQRTPNTGTSPTDGFARDVAKQVLRLLDERGSLPVIGVSSREREEEVQWRDASRGSASRAPNKHGDRWRVYVVDLGGKKAVESYESDEKARQVIRSFRRQLREQKTPTLDDALTMYAGFMKDDKGNRETSIATTTSRLRLFFGELAAAVGELDAAQCERLYEAFRTRKTRNGNPTAVDTHRNALAQAKTFLAWCVKKGWISKNPMAAVEGKGARRHGKEQLRIDESRVWLDTAIDLATSGDAGAVAAMMSLLMGMRASEIVERIVRDVDDDGRLLWIPKAKTRHGVRKLAVPEVIRPFLVALAKGKKPEDRLFGTHWRDWPRKNVQRICRLAGVATITAHGMRGTHSTLAIAAGATGDLVAGALGHGSKAVTFGSYVAAGTKEAADAKVVLTVVQGGKTDEPSDGRVETIEPGIVSTGSSTIKTRVNQWS